MKKSLSTAPLTIHEYLTQMRTIPAGTFEMGTNLKVRFSDQKFNLAELDIKQPGQDYVVNEAERPIHQVRLSPFQMGATPVTVGMWEEFCRATRISMPSAPAWGWKAHHPMVFVSYEDIAGEEGVGGYCEWASKRTGSKFCLPTEAQWEYCARDEGRSILYPWGNNFDPGKLWCSAGRQGQAGRTTPVVREERVFINKIGLSDMAGNVFQICRDWYGAYSGTSATDPVGPSTGTLRCLRGGTWFTSQEQQVWFRCTARFKFPTIARSPTVGFRLAIQ